MAIQFVNHSNYVYKQIDATLLKEEEDADWQREQDNDAEFDYLDAQINKTEKIKQTVRDKSLIKKSQSQILKEKNEKEYLLKEQQYKSKQKKIQERKEKKEEDKRILLAYQHAEALKTQQQLEALKSLEDLELDNKKNKNKNKNVDECEWEDLY